MRQSARWITPQSAAIGLAIILTICAQAYSWPAYAGFIVSAAGTLLLAREIARATGILATLVGPQPGALLSAAFGNSVELIIALTALHAGLYNVVRASILGGVLVNLLLTLGLCMTIGGLRHRVQTFHRGRAGINSAMLFMAVTGLGVTSLYAFERPAGVHLETLSALVSAVFLIIYMLGLVFSIGTHRGLLSPADAEAESAADAQEGEKRPLRVWLVLIVATVLVAWFSERLVGTVDPLARQAGLRPTFIGLVFLPVIGGAPEMFSAVLLARRNQMDGAVEIAVGSSLQIALFIAPVLVLVGAMIARPLTLVFTPIQMALLFLAVGLTSVVSLDGETTWYEGALAIAMYAIFSLLLLFL